MQKHTLLFALFVSFLSPVQANDSPETLEWVQRVGKDIESQLQDAIVSHDLPNLLVKLMESHDAFDAIALAGLHCHEARISAEKGRTYCNWLNGYSKDKDLNTITIRAQEAREEALRMIASAQECKGKSSSSTSEQVTLSAIILAETKSIQQILDSAQDAPSHVDYYHRLDQAYRLLVDLSHMTATLRNCDAAHTACANATNECLLALFSKSDGECQAHVQETIKWLENINLNTRNCR
jgi:hypothetical protein